MGCVHGTRASEVAERRGSCEAWLTLKRYGRGGCLPPLQGLGSPVFNLLSHAVIPIPGDAVATISTGTVFDVQSAQLLAPRGMWGPCQEAVIEIKGRVNDFLVQSGVVSYKVGTACGRHVHGLAAPRHWECLTPAPPPTFLLHTWAVVLYTTGVRAGCELSD